jgi:hypothetical protein
VLALDKLVVVGLVEEVVVVKLVVVDKVAVLD